MKIPDGDSPDGAVSSRLSHSRQLAGMVRTVAAAHGAATAVVVPAGKHGIEVGNHCMHRLVSMLEQG